VADTFGFSLNDSKRIGKAVRLVERSEPRQQLGGQNEAAISRGVRLLIGKHEGSNGWAKETTAVVTIYNGDPIASAVTVVARNQFVTFPTSADCTQHWVALGHNGWGWQAINRERACTTTCSMDWAGVDFSAFPGFDEDKIQLLGHNTSGPCLLWYDVTNVDVVTNVTLTTSAIEFQRMGVGVVTTQTAVTVAISITTCATAAT
jgi:hypothetical protein